MIHLSVESPQLHIFADRCDHISKVVIGEKQALRLKQLGATGVRYLREEVPVDTGRLRGSIRYELQAGGFKHHLKFVEGKPYGIYVRMGTRPHWAPIGALKGWARRHGINPYALQRAIAQRGTKANPYHERAFVKMIDDIEDTAEKIGQDIAIELTEPLR